MSEACTHGPWRPCAQPDLHGDGRHGHQKIINRPDEMDSALLLPWLSIPSPQRTITALHLCCGRSAKSHVAAEVDLSPSSARPTNPTGIASALLSRRRICFDVFDKAGWLPPFDELIFHREGAWEKWRMLECQPCTQPHPTGDKYKWPWWLNIFMGRCTQQTACCSGSRLGFSLEEARIVVPDGLSS